MLRCRVLAPFLFAELGMSYYITDTYKKLQGNSVLRVSFATAFFVFTLVASCSAQAVIIDWIGGPH